MGITANGIDKPLPQSTETTEFYHIGTKEPYQISGEAISQRRRLVEVMERKDRETDCATAYQTLLELRYLCFKSWEQIAVDMGYDLRWLYRLHHRALNAVSEASH